jgi:hypothetical protein
MQSWDNVKTLWNSPLLSRAYTQLLLRHSFVFWSFQVKRTRYVSALELLYSDFAIKSL